MSRYIPSDLLWQILVQLPAKSLFRLRSVCKKWLLIIDDPSFIKAHTAFTSADHTLLLRNKPGTPLYSFSLDSLNFINGPQRVDAALVKCSHLYDLFDVAFCNGLIFRHTNNNWTILNPLTNRCHNLPNQPLAPASTFFCFGFGYDCDADDYKVVRIDKMEGKYVFPVFVYSLKSDSWRSIKGYACGTPWQVRAAYLDGTLYWSSQNKTAIAFNLSSESFYQLPLPPIKHQNCILRMVGLDGCLFCCEINYAINLFDVWLMGSVEKSWSRKFSLRLSAFDTPMKLWVVAYLKGKEQLVLQHYHGFLWCDIRNNCVKKFSIHGFPDLDSSQICPGSLVRFNGRGSSVGNISRTRLKLCVRNVEEKCCSDNTNCSEDMCWRCEEK